MSKFVFNAVLLLGALVCLVESASPCTCSLLHTPPCVAFRETPVVFAGLVRSIEEEKIDIIRFGKKENIRVGLTAHFVVEEALKGISVSEVDVATGGGGGDCGYNFKAGERYLVYAYRSGADALSSAASRTVFGGGSKAIKQDALTTTICSRTRTLSEAQDDLELIRALIAGKPQTRIFGSVSEFARDLRIYGFNIDYVGPIADVTIKVESAVGKFETKTDSRGHYRIGGVPPGNYNIRALLPKDYGPLFSFVKDPRQVEISPQGCSAEADFDAQIDGRIAGRIFGAEGKPVPDQVEISIATSESAAKGTPFVEARSEYTDKEGRYHFEGVRPGRYVLGVSIADVPAKHTPFPRTYYPKGNDPSQAAIIDLAKGQKLQNMDLRLPPRLTERTIVGVVVLEDGKPAVGAKIVTYDSEDLQHSVFGFDAETDSSGRFTIKSFKERKSRLHAYLSKSYFAGTGVQSEMVEVDTNSEGKPIRLILNKPGIFKDQPQ